MKLTCLALLMLVADTALCDAYTVLTPQNAERHGFAVVLTVTPINIRIGNADKVVGYTYRFRLQSSGVKQRSYSARLFLEDKDEAFIAVDLDAKHTGYTMEGGYNDMIIEIDFSEQIRNKWWILIRSRDSRGSSFKLRVKDFLRNEEKETSSQLKRSTDGKGDQIAGSESNPQEEAREAVR